MVVLLQMLSSSLCPTISPKNDNNGFSKQDGERQTARNSKRYFCKDHIRQYSNLYQLHSADNVPHNIDCYRRHCHSSPEDVINYINLNCLRLCLSWELIVPHRCRLFALSSYYFYWADNRKTPLKELTKMKWQ